MVACSRLALALTKDFIGKHWGQLLIPSIVKESPIDGEVPGPAFAAREGIYKKSTIGGSDFLGGFGVKLEIFVDGRTIRDAELIREVLRRGGGDQGKLWNRFTVVLLREGVADEGPKLGLVSIEVSGTREGRIVAEEGNDGVGSKASEPLVRGFKMSSWSRCGLQFFG